MGQKSRPAQHYLPPPIIKLKVRRIMETQFTYDLDRGKYSFEIDIEDSLLTITTIKVGNNVKPHEVMGVHQFEIPLQAITGLVHPRTDLIL